MSKKKEVKRLHNDISISNFLHTIYYPQVFYKLLTYLFCIEIRRVLGYHLKRNLCLSNRTNGNRKVTWWMLENILYLTSVTTQIRTPDIDSIDLSRKKRGKWTEGLSQVYSEDGTLFRRAEWSRFLRKKKEVWGLMKYNCMTPVNSARWKITTYTFEGWKYCLMEHIVSMISL